MSKSDTLRDEGNTMFNNGDYEKALDLYRQAMEIEELADGYKALLHNNMAACYLKLDKFDDVITETSNCLDLSPNNRKALYRRCLAYKHQGEITRAYADIIVARHYGVENKDIEETFTQLIRKVSSEQGCAAPRTIEQDYGKASFEKGQWEQALVFYHAALGHEELSEEEKIDIHNKRAACLLNVGQYDEAVEEATLCLSLSPRHAAAVYTRSQAYQAVDNIQKAYKDSKKAVRYDPDDPELQKWLKKMEDAIVQKAEEFRAAQGAYCEMDLHIEDDSD